MSSVLEAGPCVRTNQLDFDDEVTFAAKQKLYDVARERAAGHDARPFCMVVSLTHPHDPYAITRDYWDLYSDDDIDMPAVHLDAADSDPHSQRLRFVCENDRTPPTDAQIRAARRAYYGATSYVDTQFGSVLAALEQCGFADDTIVIVTSDHGDMLGERGLWYKMTFFEGGCRVPLIIHAPGRFDAARVCPCRTSTCCRRLSTSPAPRRPAAGRIRSMARLVPHLHGTPAHDVALGEYLAEGAVAPVVMIRSGDWKYVHCPLDPDQLYNLSDDPRELTNLADTPEAADVLAAFRAQAAQRWNLPELDRQVRASQRRRRFHYTATTQGRIQAWDWQPFTDASQRYMRNHIGFDTLEAMARFPRVGR